MAISITDDSIKTKLANFYALGENDQKIVLTIIDRFMLSKYQVEEATQEEEEAFMRGIKEIEDGDSVSLSEFINNTQ